MRVFVVEVAREDACFCYWSACLAGDEVWASRRAFLALLSAFLVPENSLDFEICSTSTPGPLSCSKTTFVIILMPSSISICANGVNVVLELELI